MRFINNKKTATALILGASAITTQNANAQSITAAGLWEFENASNLTAATTGADLITEGAGFTAVTGSGGTDNGAVQIDIGSYYKMTHGLGSNGGGAFLNQYTLLIDFKIDSNNTQKWTTFFQTNVDNANDGEYFYRQQGSDTELGVGSEGYIGASGTVVQDQWNRLLISIDNTGTNAAYINGTHVGNHAAGTVDGRWSLEDVVIMFGDNDGDDGAIQVSTLAIYDKAVSSVIATELGNAGDDVNLVMETPVGDTNGDFKVDLQDFYALRDNFGIGNSLAQGDVDFDGDVDQADFLIIRDEFPKYNNGASLASAIPEPTSLALISLTAIALLKRK